MTYTSPTGYFQTFDPGKMEYDTRYYWKIVTWDEYVAKSEGPIWSFTTMSGTVTILPSDYDIFRGKNISGGLSDLYYSDNSYLVIEPGFVVSEFEPPVWLRIVGKSSTSDPSKLSFTLESHTTRSGKISQTIELYNYDSEDYEIVDSRQASPSDLVVEIVISSNPSRFIDSSSLEMEAQIKYIQTGPVVGFPWWIKFDQTIWKITY